MQNKILALFEKQGDGLSFLTLEEIEGFSGKSRFGNEEKNVFLWFNCSEEAIDAINSLLIAEKIIIRDTPELTYIADGERPRFPLAHQKRRYASPRWAPAVLDKGPLFKA